MENLKDWFDDDLKTERLLKKMASELRIHKFYTQFRTLEMLLHIPLLSEAYLREYDLKNIYKLSFLDFKSIAEQDGGYFYFRYLPELWKVRGSSDSDLKRIHKNWVHSALVKGNKVPASVLNEYPELKNTKKNNREKRSDVNWNELDKIFHGSDKPSRTYRIDRSQDVRLDDELNDTPFSEKVLNRKEIEELLTHSITKIYGDETPDGQLYSINNNNKVDVYTDIEISSKLIHNGKLLVKFNHISGNFICNHIGLTSLEGMPESIEGTFSCFGNRLTSLEGMPQTIEGDFDCSGNRLTSLEGMPESIGGDFACTHNKLTSLKGMSQFIGWNFNCSDNRLTSLEGFPQSIEGVFNCRNNPNLTAEEVLKVIDRVGVLYADYDINFDKRINNYFKKSRKHLSDSSFSSLIDRLNSVYLAKKEKFGEQLKIIFKLINAKIPKAIKDIFSSVSNTIYGEYSNIVTPQITMPCRYAIMELNNLIPSNDPTTFNPNKKYPNECQTRSYKEDKGEQEKVITAANNFDFSHLLNNSPDATTGTPIVLPTGVVIGGNGRTMILNRVALFNPQKYNYYKEKLLLFALFLKFDSNDLEVAKSMKRPVLVRIVDAPLSDCVENSNFLNTSNMQNYDAIREGIAIARQLEQHPTTLDKFASAVINSGAETFSNLMDSKTACKEIISIFEANKIINKANTEALIDLKTKMFTDTGELLIQYTLLAFIIPDKSLIKAAKLYTDKLFKVIPHLLLIKRLPGEWNIIPNFQNVIKLENARRLDGFKNREEYLRQGQLWRTLEPLDILLWRIIEDMPITAFRDFIKYYSAVATEVNNDIDPFFKDDRNVIGVITTWLKNNNEGKKPIKYNDLKLSGIDMNYNQDIKDFIDEVFKPKKVKTSITDKRIIIHNARNNDIIGEIFTDSFTLTHQLDLWGKNKEIGMHDDKLLYIAKYVKKLIKKPAPDNRLFDKILIENEIENYTENLTVSEPIENKCQCNETLNDDTENLTEIEEETEIENSEEIESNEADEILDDDLSEKTEDKLIGLDDLTNLNENKTLEDLSEIVPNVIKLTGKNETLLERLSTPFSMLIWGTPGSGKSTYSLILADDLARYGDVLYFTCEEKLSSGRISERVSRVGLHSKNVFFNDVGTFDNLIKTINSRQFSFVIIDSISMLDTNVENVLQLIKEFDNVNFILITHALKGGKAYKGVSNVSHLVDTVIRIEKGIATLDKHRDAPGDKTINVFDNPVKKYKFRMPSIFDKF